MSLLSCRIQMRWIVLRHMGISEPFVRYCLCTVPIVILCVRYAEGQWTHPSVCSGLNEPATRSLFGRVVQRLSSSTYQLHLLISHQNRNINELNLQLIFHSFMHTTNLIHNYPFPFRATTHILFIVYTIFRVVRSKGKMIQM